MVRQLEKAELAAQKTNQKLKEINDIKLNHVQGQIDGLNGQMDKVISTSAKVAAAFAAVGAGAVKLGLNAVEMADTIATEADKLGLTSEALQRYNYLALQTDVSNESLAKSIVKINGDIGNLALGIEDNGNKALLSLIGTTKNADGTAKTAEQTFLEVVGALSQMEDQAVRTGLANQIFGERFAKDLNPLFNKAPEDIKAFLDEFEEIGYLSNETVDDLAALDEKLNMTRQIFTQLGAEVGIQVTPFIEDFTEFVKNNKEELGQWASATMDNIIKVAKAMYDMRGALVALVAIFAVLKVALAVAGSIIAYQKAVEGATGAMAIFNGVVSANPLGALAAVLAIVVGGIIAYKAVTGDATSASKELSGEMDDLIKKTAELKAESEKAESQIITTEKATLANAEAARVLSNELYELESQENKTTEQKQRMKTIVDELNRIFPDLNIVIDANTFALNKEKIAVDNLIASYTALAMAKAYQGKLDQAADMIVTAKENKKDAESKKEGLSKYEAAWKVESSLDAMSGIKTNKIAGVEQYGDAVGAIESNEKIIADNEANIARYVTEIEKYKKSAGTADDENKPRPYTPPDFSKGGGKGAAKASKDVDKSAKEAEQAAKEAEERRKEQVKAYENTITEYERLDKRYNDQKKGYDELSLNDELYSIGERAKRYRSYADEVLTVEYMTEEEKAKLHKQYIERAEDVELEYFNFEKNIRDSATKDLQDEYDKARQLQIEYLSDRKNNIAEALTKEKEAITAAKDAELKSISERIAAQKELLQTKN